MADLTDDEAFENDLVKYAGTREERRIFAQYSKDEAAQIDLMKKAGTDKFEMYSCFGGFTSDFEKANEILGYRITDIMFSGTDDELKQTKVTELANQQRS